MEKITIAKIVNTKPDKYGVSVRVKSKEHGEKCIFMISVKDANLIQVGQTYEGEKTLWKVFDEGTDKETEWWSFKLPSAKESKSGNDDILAALRTTYAEARAANVEAGKAKVLITDLYAELIRAGVIKINPETNEDLKTTTLI